MQKQFASSLWMIYSSIIAASILTGCSKSNTTEGDLIVYASNYYYQARNDVDDLTIDEVLKEAFSQMQRTQFLLRFSDNCYDGDNVASKEFAEKLSRIIPESTKNTYGITVDSIGKLILHEDLAEEVYETITKDAVVDDDCTVATYKNLIFSTTSEDSSKQKELVIEFYHELLDGKNYDELISNYSTAAVYTVDFSRDDLDVLPVGYAEQISTLSEVGNFTKPIALDDGYYVVILESANDEAKSAELYEEKLYAEKENKFYEFYEEYVAKDRSFALKDWNDYSDEYSGLTLEDLVTE